MAAHPGVSHHDGLRIAAGAGISARTVNFCLCAGPRAGRLECVDVRNLSGETRWTQCGQTARENRISSALATAATVKAKKLRPAARHAVAGVPAIKAPL